jgi:hypothetical protein
VKTSPVRPRVRYPVAPNRVPRNRQVRQTGLPNLNISKIIQGFSSLRSTIHDLSQSLQRLEALMDHTTQLFSVGKNARTGMKLPTPPLPQPAEADPFKDEEIPIIKLPDIPLPQHPLLRLLQHIDITKIWAILRSPIVQSWLTRMFTPKPTTSQIATPKQRKPVHRSRLKQKQIRRKRVRP